MMKDVQEIVAVESQKRLEMIRSVDVRQALEFGLADVSGENVVVVPEDSFQDSPMLARLAVVEVVLHVANNSFVEVDDVLVKEPQLFWDVEVHLGRRKRCGSLERGSGRLGLGRGGGWSRRYGSRRR